MSSQKPLSPGLEKGQSSSVSPLTAGWGVPPNGGFLAFQDSSPKYSLKDSGLGIVVVLPRPGDSSRDLFIL